MTKQLTPIQLDRALGCILGSAGGDALGSQYEFGPAHDDLWRPTFGKGIFGHAIGEWTDDTSMAMPILEWAASRESLPLRHILERWIEWSKTSKDVGAQTRTVLTKLTIDSKTLEEEAYALAVYHHTSTGKSAGNGSLMRIGPFALAYLQDDTIDLATLKNIVQWTHFEEDNFIAAALWAEAIRTTIVTGTFDMKDILKRIGYGNNTRWLDLIEAALAPTANPRDYLLTNGWVVAAFQASLTAISITSTLEEAIEAAIRGGGDTDTVAAITGSLAGALYGAEAIPTSWTSVLHGWPGYSLEEIQKLVHKATETTI